MICPIWGDKQGNSLLCSEIQEYCLYWEEQEANEPGGHKFTCTCKWFYKSTSNRLQKRGMMRVDHRSYTVVWELLHKILRRDTMSMNKRIAELRGENRWDTCLFVIGGECKPWDKPENACDECKDSNGYIPYDTDIACAMELWDEMPVAELRKTPDAFGKGETLVFCEVLIKGEVHVIHGAKTEADAIAGAWLKWKEG